MALAETLGKFIQSLVPLAWPFLIAIFFFVYYNSILRIFNALVRRIERGDEVHLSTWITLGKSSGPLKLPATDGYVTDDHVSLIHRSWRVSDRDKEFGNQKMYQIHVILFGERAALDRVEYVLYRLDPAYPNPVRSGGTREKNFELKELANGYSLIRADVKIKEQDELIYLSRFIDLTDVSPPLKGSYST
jgi:hypothetical protein